MSSYEVMVSTSDAFRIHQASLGKPREADEDAEQNGAAAGEIGAQDRQEDAMEYFTYLMDQLHEQMNGVDTGGESIAVEQAKEESEWQPVAKGKGSRIKHVVDDVSRQSAARINASTAISRIFHGSLRSEVLYGNRRVQSSTFQRFHCLSLEMSQTAETLRRGPNGGGDSNSYSSNVCNLESLLDAYFSNDIVGSSSSTSASSARQRTTKQMSLDHCPAALVLQLNRFGFDYHRNVPVKVDRCVDYAEELRVKEEYMTPALVEKLLLEHGAGAGAGGAGAGGVGSDSGQKAGRNGGHGSVDLTYQLASIVMHHGRTASSGHYTAFVCDIAGGWWHLDDARVRRVDAREAMSAVDCAYLLFYVRRDAVMRFNDV
jgi:ubiquitin C-terminal hydrolase